MFMTMSSNLACCIIQNFVRKEVTVQALIKRTGDLEKKEKKREKKKLSEK